MATGFNVFSMLEIMCISKPLFPPDREATFFFFIFFSIDQRLYYPSPSTKPVDQICGDSLYTGATQVFWLTRNHSSTNDFALQSLYGCYFSILLYLFICLFFQAHIHFCSLLRPA